MTTDPKALPEADPHTGNREIDPITGYDSTGHEWGGIRELNTPFPKVALIALVITVIYSIIAWVLLPAWPLGRDYTRGLLGLDQNEMAVERLHRVETRREAWLAAFDDPNFDSTTADVTLLARTHAAADRIYQDNCAACHGAEGHGGPGFPVLTDDYWLWGGDPGTIAETLRVGINTAHPEARYAQMPAFDWMDRPDRLALAEYVASLPSGAANHDSAAAILFEENCVACHGERGRGGLMNGAPSLTDDAVIYGQDPDSVVETLRNGRQGLMPYWSNRLSGAEINLLAVYVSNLGNATEGGDP
ncbi:MAG TPA: cytochrome-c oxidase, cbb3-type subunit III [Amaricoccus sp.]|uniref:cytochrome-c oxidase, cbb3-type subunit III n=1 Tax=Amaricoccus sp. TaxID=1872485 RepID=UPI002C724D74|nr:cytochrome-c oxidase, cbb3-type subunit III [Amaricoccus sp.]HMQ91666.1 cytochrome-c oxidase, cbb3-type subunit III [Amaricoccus sp.]HMR52231.1 cytochrome-c oxidase, cbb3-type subunit III [Amaricoccus sp.]HMT99083.1 cytochrome-c oxidase, cbb3-type subunit III [Amaricoccus sp.]